MKSLFVFAFVLFVSSCSSKQPYKDAYVHPILQPYVDNWKIQHIDWKKMHPQFTDGSIMPFTFDTKLRNVVGRCEMNPDINKRALYISPWAWNDYPDKRENYVIHLMNLCIGGDKGSELPYGDFLYYGY